MDWKNIFRNESLGVVCVTVMLLIAAQSFGAVTNGFFDSSLDGWNYSNDNSVVWSPDSYAEMNENGTLSISTLSQYFQIDNNSQTLTFTVHTPQPVGGETDHFYIGLFQGSDVPLMEMDESNYLFHWDSDDGHDVSEPQYFDWDFSDDPDGGLIYDFTIPVADRNDQWVTLLFQLDHVWGTIDPDTGYITDPITAVRIDNVELHGAGTTPVVPVPGAIGLVLAGLMALGVFKKKLI